MECFGGWKQSHYEIVVALLDKEQSEEVLTIEVSYKNRSKIYGNSDQAQFRVGFSLMEVM
jgi:hypothetical protein